MKRVIRAFCGAALAAAALGASTGAAGAEGAGEFVSPLADFRCVVPEGWKVSMTGTRDQAPQYVTFQFSDPRNDRRNLVVRWHALYRVHELPNGTLELYSGVEDYASQIASAVFAPDVVVETRPDVVVAGRTAKSFSGLLKDREVDMRARFGDLKAWKPRVENQVYAAVPMYGGFYVLISAGPLGDSKQDEAYRRLLESFSPITNGPGGSSAEETPPSSLEHVADADATVEALQKALAELAKAPRGFAPRRRAMSIALALKPRPELPKEALKLAEKAQKAAADAKKPADFKKPIERYEEALLLAPWEADLYFNLADAQEKAGRDAEALASFRFYLMAAPDAEDKDAVLQRVGGLEFLVERAIKRAARAASIAVLRSKLAGRYESSNCYTYYTDDYGRKLHRGCTASDRSSRNWYDRYPGSDPGWGHFEVYDNGIINLLYDNKPGYHRAEIGVVDGPFLSAVQWYEQNSSEELGRVGRMNPPDLNAHDVADIKAKATRRWGGSKEDGSWIETSYARPVDESRYSADARYDYSGWRRQ